MSDTPPGGFDPGRPGTGASGADGPVSGIGGPVATTGRDTASIGFQGASLPRAASDRLRRKRRQARAVLWLERLWPAGWPAASLVGGYGAAAMLGAVALLPPAPRAALTLAVPTGVIVLLLRGVRPLRPPAPAEVDRRLEIASGLRHHPLRALADRPALIAGGGVPAGAASAGPETSPPDADPLWRAHLERAVSQLHRLRVGAPRSVLAGRDMRALRGLVLVGLAASLVVAGPEAGPRLAAAFTPALPSGAPVAAPVLQAWITPPPSTGLPPVFLHLASPAPGVTVPAGSKLQVSLSGGSATPTLMLGDAAQPFAALDPTSWQAERVLDASGLLAVRRGGSQVAAWSLTVVADDAPVVAWAAPPGPAAAGARAQSDTRTRLPWHVSHRYGVASLAAELRLDARPADPAALVPIPLPGAPKDAHGTVAPDLAANPWAGLPVAAVLVARDGQGLAGRSDVAHFTLPERAFQNPLARALIATRRRLTLDPEHRDPAVADLQALADAPAAGDSLGTYLGLSTIASLLSQEDGPADAVAQAQARMWEMALALDAGAVERTARVVEQSREQVRQQLDDLRRDPAKRADPKQQAELKARVEAMREAIRQHLQAMLEQARKDGTLQPQDPAAQRTDARDLDRMLREMEDAAQQGRMDEAEQKMEQLQKQMQALDDAAKQSSQQARDGKGGKAGGKQDSERAQTAKDAVQDLLKREGGLLDHAQGRDRGREPGRGQGRQNGEPAPGEQDARDGASPQPGSLGPDGTAPGGNPDQQPGDQQGAEKQAGQDDGPGGVQLPGPQGREGAPGAGGTGGAPPRGQAQRQPGKGRQGHPDAPPSAQAAARPPSPRDTEGRVQRAMRRALGELMQQFGDSAGSVPKSLGDADQAMQQAEDALKAGHDDAAREAEQRAVADLRKGGQEMGQTMQRQFGLSESKDGKGEESQEGDGEGGTGDKPGKSGRAKRVQRDPLGRLTQDGGHGISDGDDVHVPEQAEQARSRDLQDELRRRGADRARPQDELDYIGRLLKPF